MRSGERLLVVVLALAGAAGVVCLAPPRPSPRGEAMQRLVGGLGLGPALTPGRDGFRFDPRLSGRPEEDEGPVPAGDPLSARYGWSLFSYPPLAPPRGRE